MAFLIYQFIIGPYMIVLFLRNHCWRMVEGGGGVPEQLSHS